MVGCAVAVVVGHVWPIWAGFRGGKGVATTAAGAWALVAPVAVVWSVVVFGSDPGDDALSCRPDRWRLRWRCRSRPRSSMGGRLHVGRRAGAGGADRLAPPCQPRRGWPAEPSRASARRASKREGGGHSARSGTRGRWLGHGAGGAPGARRPRRRAVGARPRARRRDGARAAPTPSTCPTSTFRRRCIRPPICARRWTARGSSSWPCRRTACATSCAALSADVPADAVVVSATKGLEQESLYRMSEIVEQELGPGVRVAVLSGPSFASELAREMPTAMAVASRDAAAVDAVQHEFRAPVRPPVRHERRGRRRDGRRAEERDRDCRRAGRGHGPGLQRAGRPDHARPGGDVAPGVRRRRAARDAVGAGRPGRSGADLHQRAQPQPARRHRAGAGPAPAGDPRRHAHGGRGRAHVERGAGAGGAPPDRAADCLAGGGPAGGPEGSAHGAVRADGAAAARRANRAAEVTRWGFSTSFGRG